MVQMSFTELKKCI